MSAAAVVREPDLGLLAGVVKRPITPTVQGRRVWMGGYGRNRLATGIHDELWVRALALRYAGVIWVWVSLDLIGLSREDVELVRSLAFGDAEPGRVALTVTCTGTHAGPDALGFWTRRSSAGSNARFMRFLCEETARVARLAVEALEPACLYAARTEWEPAGVSEGRELLVLDFRALSGRQRAIAVNCAGLPGEMGPGSTLIGADLLHWLYLDLDRAAASTALVACAGRGAAHAAAGEMGSERAEQAGRSLGAAVRSALDAAVPVPVDRLRVIDRTISMPVVSPAAMRRLPHGAWSWLWSQRRIESRVEIVDLGPVRIGGLPGVASPALEAWVRKLLDAPYRGVFCLANDCLGALDLPDPELAGGAPGIARDAGYPTLVGPRAGTIVADEIANLVLESRRS